MRRAWLGIAVWVSLCAAGTAGGAEWPDLSRAPAAEGGGARDAAVVVGIEGYTYLAPVPGAVDNAKDWYRWLKETRGVRAVKLLTDASATRHSILAAVDDAAGRVGEGGTLWFVFIGHGAPSADRDDGVLVGATAQQRVVDFFPNTLARDELLDALERGGQAETVVVLDACFSGRQSGGAALVPDLQPALVSGSWQPDRTTVLTAAQGDQFAGPLPGARRPAFSYLVLGALRGWGDRDGDRRITAREALEYASDALFEVVDDRTQTPTLLGPSPGLVLASPSRPEDGPDLLAFKETTPAPSPPVPDPVVGHVETNTGDTDLLAAARELERLRQEREAREAREKELEERLAAERRRAREEAEDALRSDARSEWLALASLRDAGGPEAVQIVELYVGKYGDASVTVDGRSYEVQIAQVSEAREWLERNAGKAVRAVTGGLGGEVIDAHGYELVAIEPGEFWMGSPSDEKGRDDDEARHKVRLTRGFALGTTEVTQGLYRAVMGRNPSMEEYDGVSLVGDDKPVQKVSWKDAVTFCNALSEQEGLTPAYRISGDTVTWDRDADGYRLPTESEWEYAARAGSSQLFSGADSYDDVCGVGNVSDLGATQKFDWSEDWSKQCTDRHHGAADVGAYRANAWGLYDMTGNVWEWAWDWYGDYPSGTVTYPTGPNTGSYRVLRGGSWSGNPRNARVALRLGDDPGIRRSYLGFRLARSLP